MAFRDAFAQFPMLGTPRLLLTELCEEDAESYYLQIRSALDAPGRPPWGYGYESESVDNARRAMGFARSAWAKKARLKWAVRLKGGDNTLIGQSELFDLEGQSKAELGYWLGTDHQNQGFMTEAVRTVVRYGFDTMGLHRIYARTSTQNAPSLALLKKVGFIEEGILRQNDRRDGVWDDSALMAILRSDPLTSAE
jgi:ribosomal-protein-alanine N-acetyltransferase